VKNEIVAKSEAAKRWGVVPAAVTKYIGKGLPVRADGKLDWPAADAWRHNNNLPHRSGSFKSRVAIIRDAALDRDRRRVAAESGAATPATSEEFNRGAAWMARQLCESSRTAWPQFVASMDFEGVPVKHRVNTRILLTGLMSHLIEAWSKGFLVTGELPPMDWSAFGKNSAEAELEFAELLKEWRSQ
jgi:hypothetical protein